MTDEELVKLYQEGDNSALDELLEQKKGAIHTVVNKYYSYKLPYIDKEDLIQEAYIAAIKAAVMFKIDMSKGTNFANYMMGAIDHKMLYVMRQGRKQIDENKTSIDIKVYDNDDKTLGDTISSKENYYDDIEQSIYNQEVRRELEDAMDKNLTLQQRQVIKFKNGWNGKCLSNTDIKECLKIGNSKISELNFHALATLRKVNIVKELAKEYYDEKYLSSIDTYKAINLEQLKDKWMV